MYMERIIMIEGYQENDTLLMKGEYVRVSGNIQSALLRQMDIRKTSYLKKICACIWKHTERIIMMDEYQEKQLLIKEKYVHVLGNTQSTNSIHIIVNSIIRCTQRKLRYIFIKFVVYTDDYNLQLRESIYIKLYFHQVCSSHI